MEQKDVLLGHVDDLAAKAVKSGCAASRFLTPAEAQSIIAQFTRRHDAALIFDGGYEGAERVRAIFLNPDWGKYDRSELFTVFKITVQETLGHRDILGALMALGIERNTIGDIIESPLAFICLPELSGYIAENFTKAGRGSVTLHPIPLRGDEALCRVENLTIRTDTVASLRLDAMLGIAFGLSRSKAVELIEAGRVSLNHELCTQPAKEAGEGAVLSVRGLGRAKVLEVGGLSKKGRIFIKMGLYGT